MTKPEFGTEGASIRFEKGIWVTENSIYHKSYPIITKQTNVKSLRNPITP